MTVVRFAPSPTGFLHIGSARTALFNYLYAKNTQGKFLLRIEDTDAKRNQQDAVDAIFQGLMWLGLNWDGEAVFQSRNFARHREYAYKLVNSGHAYLSYETPEEVEKIRTEKGRFVFRSQEIFTQKRAGIEPVVRFRVDASIGDITVHDTLHGDVNFPMADIEDFVILRSDGSPTYMLSVVCDDIDMGVTHIIRGDDHLTNTPKQILIYKGLGCPVPKFTHIPLIHGMDGKKLSKRHGALGVEEYEKLGYLPEAVLNYLLKLGFSGIDEDVFTTERAIREFSINKLNKSPARFDFEKLNSINAEYIKQKSPAELGVEARFIRAAEITKHRFKTLVELKESFLAYLPDYTISSEAMELINTSREVVDKIKSAFVTETGDFDTAFKKFLENNALKFGKVGPVLRAMLIGKTSSIAIGEIATILGEKELIRRIQNI